LKKEKDVEARNAKGDKLEQHWLHEILTEQEIGEIESQITGAKEMVRTAKKVKQSCIDALKKHKDARGRPVQSLVAQFEKVLAKYSAKREAYHDCDFNGVSCRHLVANISAIMEEFHPISMREKRRNQ
jgi:hypothetical protein